MQTSAHTRKLRTQIQKGLQKGFTLIEILIVLAVFGVIISLSQGGFGLLDQFRSTGSAQETTQAIAKIRECYATQSSFSGFGASRALDARCSAYSTRVVTTPTLAVTNEWGGTRAFAAANIAGGTNNGFTITEPGLPTSACARFVETVWPSASVLTVTPSGGTAVTVKASAAVPLDGNASAVATACVGTAPFSVVVTAAK